MSKLNEPIGEVECPTKGCERKVPVFRYRPREHENMRRFAGKLYCRCPDHGQLAPQEYLLEHAVIWGPDGKPAPAKKPDKPAAAAPAKQPQLPAKPAQQTQPAEPAKPPARKGWGFFTE